MTIRTRLFSLLMVLCMMLSMMSTSVFAAEGDDATVTTIEDTAAQITGLSITVDGVTYTEGAVTIKPDSTIVYTVTGTNLDKLGEEYRLYHAMGVVSVISGSPGWDVDDTNTTATRDFSDRVMQFIDCENYRVFYRNASGDQVDTDIYLTYDHGVDGEAEITGIAMVVDGVTYTEGNVIVKPDSEVKMIFSGKNLVKNNPAIVVDTPSVYISVERVDYNADGTRSAIVGPDWFKGGENYPITYTNDNWATTQDSGITVTYMQGNDDPAKITGIAMVVDGVTYTEGNVIVKPDSTVSFIIYGENLQNLNHNEYIIDTPMAHLPCYSIPLNEDGSYTYRTYPAAFVGGVNYEITYTEDAWESRQNSGIFVTYEDGEGESGKSFFYGTNMTLGNALDLNFAVEQKLVPDGAYAEISVSFADGRTDSMTLQKSEWTEQDSLYLVTYKGLAAKEMCDTVTVKVYDSGRNLLGTREDSIRSYAMRCLENTEGKYTDEEKTLFMEMLNYGAAAQAEFAYNTANPANAGCEAYAAYDKQHSAITNSGSTIGELYMGTSLVLENRIEMQMGFTGIDSTVKAVISYQHHDEAEAKTYELTSDKFYKYNDTTYGVIIPDIVVADARQPVTVTLYNADGSELIKVTDSMESYVARSGDSGVYNAIMDFSDAAYAYLH